MWSVNRVLTVWLVAVWLPACDDEVVSARDALVDSGVGADAGTDHPTRLSPWTGRRTTQTGRTPPWISPSERMRRRTGR